MLSSGVHDFVLVDDTGSPWPTVGLCHKCSSPFLFGLRTPVCCLVCNFVSCQECASEQADWGHKYRCNFTRDSKEKRNNHLAKHDSVALGAARENIMNLGSARFPKHEHAQKYERILECLHELEAGVRETAQSNNKYAAELDMHQLLVNKMQPELEAADEKMQDLEQRLEFSLRKVALLEKENADHCTSRDDILAQLQDALLREADLRSERDRLQIECDDLKKESKDSGSQRTQLEAEVRRYMASSFGCLPGIMFLAHASSSFLLASSCSLQGQVQGLQAHLTRAYQTESENTVLQHQRSEQERGRLQLQRNLTAAEHAARQMHLAVCRGDAGPRCGIGTTLKAKGSHCEIINADRVLCMYQSGSLKNGDVILEIDGIDMRGENEQTVLSRLLANVGSEVVVLVQRSGKKLPVHIIPGGRQLKSSPSNDINPSLWDNTIGDVELVNLTDEVKSTAEILYRELENVRSMNGDLAQKLASASALHDEESRNLHHKISSLQRQVETERRRFLDKDSESDIILQTNREKLAKIEKLEEQLSEAKVKFVESTVLIERLEALNVELKHTNSVLHEAEQKAAAEAYGLKLKLHELTEQTLSDERLAKQSQLQLEGLHYKLSDMEAKLSESTTTNAKLQSEAANLKMQCKTLSCREDELRMGMEKEIEVSIRSVKELQMTHSATISKLENVEHEKRALENKLDASTAAERLLTTEMKSAAAKFESERASLREERDALSKELVEMEKRLNLRENKATEWLKDIDEKQKRIDTLLQQVESDKKRASVAQGANDSLKAQLSECQAHIEQCQEDMRRAERKSMALQQESADKDAQIESLKKQLLVARRRQKESEDVLEKLNKVHKALVESTGKVERHDKANARLSSEISCLKDELQRSHLSAQKGADQALEAERNNKKLEGQIEKLKSQVSVQEEQLQRTLTAKQKEADRALELGKINKRLEGQIEVLKSELSTLMKHGPTDAQEGDVRKALSTSFLAAPFPMLTPSHPTPQMVGLGIRITEQPPHRVTEVVEGGAAHTSGGKIMVGDVLLRIADKETKHLRFKEVKGLLFGPPGTTGTFEMRVLLYSENL